MNEHGGPGIDVADIERRLRDLWKAAAASGDTEDMQAVMRAGVLNLVIYVPGQGEEESVTQAVNVITRSHPGRVILVMPSECQSVDAGVNAHHVQVATLCNELCCGKQICGELIKIRCAKDELPHVPSLVRPLLEADLPHVLWWRACPEFGLLPFDQLAGSVNRVIFDTARETGRTSGIWSFAGRMLSFPKTAFADLGWSRLEPWRIALAEMFDLERHRKQISRIWEVEIAYKAAALDTPSSSAVMTAGWLASRLGRRIEGPLLSKAEGRAELRLTGGPEHGIISLHGKGDGVSLNGLESIRLRTQDTVFQAKCRDSTHLVAEAGGEWGPRVFHVHAEDDAILMSRELENESRDPIYEDAMRVIADAGLL